MTKEEVYKKASEIAKHIIETYDVINKDNLPNALWLATVKMAEWKDEQFKKEVSEYIELAYSNGESANLLEDLLKDI
jgi:hypothetical protein